MKVSEKELRKCAREADRELWKKTEEMNIPDHDFSSKFKARMNRVIRSSRYRHGRLGHTHMLGRVASVILICIAGSLTVTMTVPNAREHFFDAVRKQRAGHGQEIVTYSNVADVDPHFGRITWVPYGYQLVQEEINEYGGGVAYKNTRKEQIVFMMAKIDEGSKSYKNNELDNAEHVVIKEDDILFGKNHESQWWEAQWYHRNVSYLLTSENISRKDFLKILETINYDSE